MTDETLPPVPRGNPDFQDLRNMTDGKNITTPKNSTLEIARERLSGALLKLCVQQLEKFDQPWKKVNQKNQQIVLDEMGLAIDDIVSKVVAMIATDNRPAIIAEVDSVTFKDGVKAVISMSRATDGRHELADATGSRVLIAIADHTKYINGKDDVQPNPDQMELDIQSAEDAATEPTTTSPSIDEAVKAFRNASKTAAKSEDRDWDAGWDKISTLYPNPFIDDHYTELSAAYADGWEEGDSGD